MRWVCKKIVLYYIVHIYPPFTRKQIVSLYLDGTSDKLGSCHFRNVWTTCLPHKGEGILLNTLPKDTTSELTGLFSTTSPKCRAPSREAVDTIFEVFWYDSTDIRNEPLVYRLRSRRSNHYAIAPMDKTQRSFPLFHIFKYFFFFLKTSQEANSKSHCS